MVRGVETGLALSERQRTAKQAAMSAPTPVITTRLMGITPPKANGR